MPQYNRTLDFVMTQTDDTAFVVKTTEYAANDALGPIGLVKTGSGGGMLLRGVSIRDKARQDVPYIIHIYRTEPSAIADSVAFAPSVADGDLELGIVTINAADYITANGNAYSKVYKAISKTEVREPGAGSFYVRLENTATKTYPAVDDIKVEFWYWMD